MDPHDHIVFRTGGGLEIGMGHVRRCLTLAETLRDMGVQCTFLLDEDPIVCNDVVAAGFNVRSVQTGHDLGPTIQFIREQCAETVIVDSYNFSAFYLSELAKNVKLVVVLDDLADRELPVGLIVNGSAGAERLPYIATPDTQFLLGPKYILLRHEFSQHSSRRISDSVERILITVGGSDPHDLTLKCTQWVSKTFNSVEQHIVLGPLFKNLTVIEKVVQESSGKVYLHRNPQNMWKLMADADIAISGGGQTTYELAAAGTPAIAVRTATNQTVNLEGLSKAGTLAWVGDAWNAELETLFIQTLVNLAQDPGRRLGMRECGRIMVDGHGTNRVGRAIVDLSK